MAKFVLCGRLLSDEEVRTLCEAFKSPVVTNSFKKMLSDIKTTVDKRAADSALHYTSTHDIHSQSSALRNKGRSELLSELMVLLDKISE